MRFPWISRSSHEETTALLSAQIASLTEERKILLDRLATLGLGGPLFSVATTEDVDDTEAEPELAKDPTRELVDQLMPFRRRPAKLADAITRAMATNRRPWSPKAQVVMSRLDEAEQQGKQAAS